MKIIDFHTHPIMYQEQSLVMYKDAVQLDAEDVYKRQPVYGSTKAAFPLQIRRPVLTMFPDSSKSMRSAH